MMVKINHMKVMEVLANTTNTIAEGEVLQGVLNAVEETKALDYVRQLAKEEIEQAEKLIQHIAPSVYKDALLELTQFVTSRDY